jgi:presenilin-like A22 family membrane protease
MKDAVPIALMGCLFVLVYGLALLIVAPFEAAGLVAFENPNDPSNVVFFFVTLVVVTAVLLLVARFWKKRVVQIIMLGSIGYLAFFVFYALMPIVVPWLLALVFSVGAAIGLIVLLVKYPEWYVIDVCGVLLGVGSIAMLGISLSVFLVIVLLAGLAVYDAVSVFGTKHMIDLADVVFFDLKLPVMFVVPKKLGFSFIRETKSLKEKLQSGEEREAFFMGLGDVVMPGILVTSAFYNIAGGGLIVALSVVLGTLVGFGLLVVFLVRGKPLPGLPFLCSGAILGYLVSSYLLYGQLVGLSL